MRVLGGLGHGLGEAAVGLVPEATLGHVDAESDLVLAFGPGQRALWVAGSQQGQNEKRDHHRTLPEGSAWTVDISRRRRSKARQVPARKGADHSHFRTVR